MRGGRPVSAPVKGCAKYRAITYSDTPVEGWRSIKTACFRLRLSNGSENLGLSLPDYDFLTGIGDYASFCWPSSAQLKEATGALSAPLLPLYQVALRPRRNG